MEATLRIKMKERDGRFLAIIFLVSLCGRALADLLGYVPSELITVLCFLPIIPCMAWICERDSRRAVDEDKVQRLIYRAEQAEMVGYHWLTRPRDPIVRLGWAFGGRIYLTGWTVITCLIILGFVPDLLRAAVNITMPHWMGLSWSLASFATGFWVAFQMAGEDMRRKALRYRTIASNIESRRLLEAKVLELTSQLDSAREREFSLECELDDVTRRDRETKREAQEFIAALIGHGLVTADQSNPVFKACFEERCRDHALSQMDWYMTFDWRGRYLDRATGYWESLTGERWDQDTKTWTSPVNVFQTLTPADDGGRNRLTWELMSAYDGKSVEHLQWDAEPGESNEDWLRWRRVADAVSNMQRAHG
jgi:hypothetical protein